MNTIGLERYGISDQMKNAITIGIQQLRNDILAERAVEKTGAIIRATTAGRIPLKMLVSVSFSLIVSGVRNMAIAKMIKKEGSIVPNAAAMQPV